MCIRFNHIVASYNHYKGKTVRVVNCSEYCMVLGAATDFVLAKFFLQKQFLMFALAKNVDSKFY